MEKIQIGGIKENRNLAMVSIMSIPDRPGVAGAIFSILREKNINCPFIVHAIDANKLDIVVLCISNNDLDSTLKALTVIKETIGAKEILCEKEVGMISIFGPHFAERAGVAGTMFSALATVGINILAISVSISSLCCIIDVKEMDQAIQAIKEAFELSD